MESFDKAASLIGLRLNQALAQSGLCSRKAAARLISEQRVTVNGKQQPHHYQVKSGDVILLDNKPLPAPAPLQYWLYHKPVGIDCNLSSKEDSRQLWIITAQQRRRFGAATDAPKFCPSENLPGDSS